MVKPGDSFVRESDFTSGLSNTSASDFRVNLDKYKLLHPSLQNKRESTDNS